MSFYENKDKYIDEYEGRKVICIEDLVGEQKALEEVRRISIRIKEEGRMRRNLSGLFRKSAIIPKSLFNLNESLIKTGKKSYNNNYKNRKINEKKEFYDANARNKKIKNNSAKTQMTSTSDKIYSIVNQNIIKRSHKNIKNNQNNDANLINKNEITFKNFHDKKEKLKKSENSILNTKVKKTDIKEIIEEKCDEREDTEENLKNNKNMIYFDGTFKKSVENKLQKDEFEKKEPIIHSERFHCSCEFIREKNNNSAFDIENNENNNINIIKKNNLNPFLSRNENKQNSKEVNFRKKSENVERNFVTRNIQQNKKYDFHRNSSQIYENDNKTENKSSKYKFYGMMQKKKQNDKKNNENLRKSVDPINRKYNNYFSNSVNNEMQNNKNNLKKENKEEVNYLLINKKSSRKKNFSNSSIDKDYINLRYGSVGSNERGSKENDSDERTKDKSNDIGNYQKKEEINYLKRSNGYSENYYDINEDNKTISDINFYRSSSREKFYEGKNKSDKNYLIKLVIRK